MSKITLTDEEMADLIGSPLASLQMKWLDEHRWPYILNRKGRPRVARAVFDKRMGIAANDEAAQTEPKWSVK